MRNNWYVITGAPGAGKSTTLELLKKKGYKTVPEAARTYIESQLNLGITRDEITADPQKLQDSIANMIIESEMKLLPDEMLFLDRGIPDNLSYYEYFKVTPPQFLLDAFEDCFYKKVFLMELLPMKNDHVRVESDEEAQELEKLAYDYFKKKNLDIVRVPVMGKEERVQFILDNL